jgi:hypothetical protein
MASWAELESEAPEFARAVRDRLQAGKHKTIATLRRDGSPRISGTEADFVGDDLWIGSMTGAVKAHDLQRDPRYALHSASADPPGWEGDAKLAGTAEEITDPERFQDFRRLQAREAGEEEPRDPGDYHLFRLEITEAVLIGLNPERTKMVIEHWHEGRGIERLER